GRGDTAHVDAHASSVRVKKRGQGFPTVRELYSLHSTPISGLVYNFITTPEEQNDAKTWNNLSVAENICAQDVPTKGAVKVPTASATRYNPHKQAAGSLLWLDAVEYGRRNHERGC
ncbi:unnamed protein product, partial [Closterium sp. Yama58-4]